MSKGKALTTLNRLIKEGKGTKGVKAFRDEIMKTVKFVKVKGRIIPIRKK
jgi:hypothetical protein